MLAALTTAAAMSRAATAQQTAPTAIPAPSAAFAAPTADRLRRVQLLDAATLTDNTKPQADRNEAARRLLARETDEARALLLRSANSPGAALAVARALGEDPSPTVESVNLLVRLLGGDRETIEAAAVGLANAHDTARALDQLIGFATSPDPTVAHAARAAAARGLGSVVDLRAVTALLTLLNDRQRIVRDAACDALGDMTGIRAYGRDADAWRAWGRGLPAKNADFRDSVLDRTKRQRPPMPTDVADQLQRLYQMVDKSQRPEALRLLLVSESPGPRLVGVRIFLRETLASSHPNPTDLARIHDMIGDSSAEVRTEIARTLGTINDRASLETMLIQLGQEPDAGVKVALIDDFGSFGDARAVPTLMQLLADPSTRVRVAACDATRKLGPEIRKDAKLLGSVVAALRAVIKSSTGDTRSAAVGALVPLGDASVQRIYLEMLDLRETPRARIAALEGLRELADPQSADRVIRWLSTEPEATVRLAALDAFAKVGSFGYHAELYRYTDPATEPDRSVRDKAMEVFVALMPSATDKQLRDYAEQFRKQNAFTQRLSVLLALADKDQKASPPALDDLAAERENIGQTFMQIGNSYLRNAAVGSPQPEPATAAFVQAAAYFRQALDYWRERGGPALTTEGLVKELMDSLLLSRQYPEAAEFARATIAKEPAQQQTVASKLANRAEDLLDATPPNVRDALRLSLESLKIAPPLDELYRQRLQKARARAEQMMAPPVPLPPVRP